MKEIDKPGAVIIEGHVQGLSNARSLGELGIPVIVIDKNNCIARYSKYCKKFFKCPDFNSDEFSSFLISLSKKEKLTGWVLIPSNDHAVKNISVHKSELSKYYRIITDDDSVISKIYNKKSLLDIAEEIEVPIPKTYYPKDLKLENFDLNFPVIVKGIEGLTFYKAMGRKVFPCDNLEKLSEVLSTIIENIGLDKIFIQEVIEKNKDNYVCSFTAFVEKGEIKTFWIGEKLREHPNQFGTATFTRSISINETYKYSELLLDKLNYTGVCEIEYLKDPSDGIFKLIEINARTWLWVGLAKACGINYAKYMYDFANDKKIDFPSVYKDKVYWINFYTDILMGSKNLSKSLKPILKKQAVHAVYYSNDIFPFFMMSILLPYIALRRL